jgi:hypothetical protein
VNAMRGREEKVAGDEHDLRDSFRGGAEFREDVAASWLQISMYQPVWAPPPVEVLKSSIQAG